MEEGTTIEYFDHLGSPLKIRATMGGLPVHRCKYDSFGNIIEESGDFELPFRFAGGIWDEDTKLIRFGVRDYDSKTGRWTSVEPLGFAGARNWYVYAGNDGVNYLDLDGRKKKLASKTFKGKVGGKDYQRAMDELAFEAFKQIICNSLGSSRERGFRIDIIGNELTAYTSDGVESGYEKEHVIITYGETTVGDGHIHWSCGQSNDFSPRDIKIGGSIYYLASFDGTFRRWKNGKNQILKPKFDFSDCKCPAKYFNGKRYTNRHDYEEALCK